MVCSNVELLLFIIITLSLIKWSFFLLTNSIVIVSESKSNVEKDPRHLNRVISQLNSYDYRVSLIQQITKVGMYVLHIFCCMIIVIFHSLNDQ